MRHPPQTVDGKSWLLAIARQTPGWISGPEVCALAGGLMLVWAVGGRSARLSETWQLAIGVGTILVTFVIALLIQNDPRSDTDRSTSSQNVPRGRSSAGWEALLTPAPTLLVPHEIDADASPR